MKIFYKTNKHPWKKSLWLRRISNSIWPRHSRLKRKRRKRKRWWTPIHKFSIVKSPSRVRVPISIRITNPIWKISATRCMDLSNRNKAKLARNSIKMRNILVIWVPMSRIREAKFQAVFLTDFTLYVFIVYLFYIIL